MEKVSGTNDISPSQLPITVYDAQRMHLSRLANKYTTVLTDILINLNNYLEDLEFRKNITYMTGLSAERMGTTKNTVKQVRYY